jgi:hypothetical protein
LAQKPLLWAEVGAHVVGSCNFTTGDLPGDHDCSAQSKAEFFVANTRQLFCSIIVTTAINLIATSP